MWIGNFNILFVLVLREEFLRTQSFWQMVTPWWPFLFCESLSIAEAMIVVNVEAVTTLIEGFPSHARPVTGDQSPLFPFFLYNLWINVQQVRSLLRRTGRVSQSLLVILSRTNPAQHYSSAEAMNLSNLWSILHRSPRTPGSVLSATILLLVLNTEY